MYNYKICIQYDGTEFYGWQSQKDGNTVQDELYNTIKKITGENVNIIGSGRTDSGVHALGQICNFHIQNSINEFKFLHSLNSILPKSIAVKDINKCDNEFHSRFDAKWRSYIYLLSKNKSPFFDKYSYFFPPIKNLNVNELKNLSEVLKGEHDFTSFCKAKSTTENKICNVKDISWRNSKDFLILNIEANRFLHGMVRTIVGTLINSVLKEKDQNSLREILNSKNREQAGEAVPARGLFLYKVKY